MFCIGTEKTSIWKGPPPEEQGQRREGHTHERQHQVDVASEDKREVEGGGSGGRRVQHEQTGRQAAVAGLGEERQAGESAR